MNDSRPLVDNEMFRLDKKRRNRFAFRHQWPAYLMLLPAFLLLTLFVVVPLVMALVRSFQDYNTSAYIGLQNYEFIFGTDLFAQSFRNVLVMTLIITVVMIVITFLFALVLKALNNKFGSFVKIIIFVPFFISGIAASVIFTLLTNYGGGLITSILISLNQDPVSFTSDEVLAYAAIIVPTVWLGFGYNTLVMGVSSAIFASKFSNCRDNRGRVASDRARKGPRGLRHCALGELASQRPGVAVRNFNLRKGADHRLRRFHADEPPAQRPGREDARLLVLAVKEHPLGLADVGPVLFLGDAVLRLDEAVKALLLFLVRRRVLHRRRLGTGARGIEECEHRIVAHALDELERFLKVLLRLAGKADDDVRREDDVRDVFTQLIDLREIFFAVVVAVHGL